MSSEKSHNRVENVENNESLKEPSIQLQNDLKSELKSNKSANNDLSDDKTDSNNKKIDSDVSKPVSEDKTIDSSDSKLVSDVKKEHSSDSLLISREISLEPMVKVEQTNLESMSIVSISSYEERMLSEGPKNRNVIHSYIPDIKTKYVPDLSQSIIFEKHLGSKKLVEVKSHISEDVDIEKSFKVSEKGGSESSKTKKKRKILFEVTKDFIGKGTPSWMPKTKEEEYKRHKIIKTVPGLELIQKIRKFYIYDNIRIIDNIYGNQKATNNCFTIRNADFQKVFYAGSVNDSKLGNVFAFSIRIVDQYSRHIITIRKHWKCCCYGLYKVDFFCPPRKLIAKMRQKRSLFSGTDEFIVREPVTKTRKFVIKRTNDKIRHEFDILDPNVSIGTILKRFENISLDRSLDEDHYVRVNVPQYLTAEDKAIILSTALMINILYLKKLRRA